MSLFYPGLAQATNNNGNPLSGAKWYFYLTGTTTPQNVYSDEEGSTSLGAVVTADSSGWFVPIYLNDSITYRAVLKTAGGAIVGNLDLDPITGPQGSDSIITPFMFGAKGDGVTDDAAALNAMFAYCMTNPSAVVVAGFFKVGSPLLVVNPDTLSYGHPTTVTSSFYFAARFVVSAAMDHVITFRRLYGLSTSGLIHIIGAPVGVYGFSSRLAQNGVYLDNCGAHNFGAKLLGEQLGYSLYETENAPSNNNTSQVSHVNGSRIGSGRIVGEMFSSTLSGRVDTGGAGSSSQVSTFTTTALPNAYLDAANRPKWVIISGHWHRVVSIDRSVPAALKVGITPWPSTAYVPGSVDWRFGAVAEVRGNDGNLINFGLISGQGVCAAYSCQSLYGGTVGEIHAEISSIGASIGFDPGGTIVGGKISRLYCEGDEVDLFVGVGIPLEIDIECATPFSYDKIRTSSWFSPGGVVTPSKGILPTGISINGVSATPSRTDGFPDTFDLARPDLFNQTWLVANANPVVNLIFSGDSSDWLARCRIPVEIDIEVTAAVTASGIPTTVTFIPPGGYTVNGSSTAIFDQFSGSPKFSIAAVEGTTDLKLRLRTPQDGGPHFAIPASTGQFLSNNLWGTLLSSTPAFVADQLDAGIIHPSRNFSVSAISFEVITAVGASNAKIAIYDYATNTRLAVSGDISTATSGIKTWSVNFTFKKGVRYLIALHGSTNSVSFRACGDRSCPTFGNDSSGLPFAITRQSVAYASGPPATLAATRTSGVVPPLFTFTAA